MALSGFEIAVGGLFSIPVVGGLVFFGYKAWGEKSLDASKLKPKKPAAAEKPAAEKKAPAKAKAVAEKKAPAAAEKPAVEKKAPAKAEAVAEKKESDSSVTDSQ